MKKKSILITGSKGFLGSNLKKRLLTYKNIDIYEYNIDDDLEKLEEYCSVVSFIFHFAAVQRPKEGETYADNILLTEKILEFLNKHKNNASILFTSSIHVNSDSDYGRTKLFEEKLLENYRNNDRKVYIYRLTNVFGPGSRPNYTSVVATFCYNISHNIDVNIHDPDTEINLIYIDDVTESFIRSLNKLTQDSGILKIEKVYTITIYELSRLIYNIKNRNRLELSVFPTDFIKKMTTTYAYFSNIRV